MVNFFTSFSDHQINKIDLPNEIWTKIFKNLPSKDVYGSLTLVNKRFQSLALDSGALRSILFESDHDQIQKNMKILKTCTQPRIEIVFENSNNSEIFSLTQNIKSLKLSNEFWSTDMPDDESLLVYEASLLINMKFIKNLINSENKLEHLELKGYQVSPNVMFEISKIKTLKTFRISDARKLIITPEVVNDFAENENQLENVEFDDFSGEYFDPHFDTFSNGFCNGMYPALNNFLKKKSKTLKSLKNITVNYLEFDKVPLTNLKLCQTLEEFCGFLHRNDIPILAELPKLQKLRLDALTDPKHFLDHVNLNQLKYLAIQCTSEGYGTIAKELTKHEFPNLERLYIEHSKMTEDILGTLISKNKKMKSIQLDRNLENSKISHEFLYHICKNTNTFVFFGTSIKERPKKYNNLIQETFEEFLIEFDAVVYHKYMKKKISFSKWCQTNLGYYGL